MKSKLLLLLSTLVLLSSCDFLSDGQSLVGTWAFDRVEYTTKSGDSDVIQEPSFLNYIVTFNSDNTVYMSCPDGDDVMEFNGNYSYSFGLFKMVVTNETGAGRSMEVTGGISASGNEMRCYFPLIEVPELEGNNGTERRLPARDNLADIVYYYVKVTAKR